MDRDMRTKACGGPNLLLRLKVETARYRLAAAQI